MSRVHVDDTKPLLTSEETAERDRYERLLELWGRDIGTNIEVVHPDLIARYRELRGAC